MPGARADLMRACQRHLIACSPILSGESAGNNLHHGGPWLATSAQTASPRYRNLEHDGRYSNIASSNGVGDQRALALSYCDIISSHQCMYGTNSGHDNHVMLGWRRRQA